jgi:hypothetical protein
MKRWLFPNSIALVGIACLVTGCAADNVTGPAQSAGDAISKLQTDLTKFQDDIDGYQDREFARTVGNQLLSNNSADTARQLQVEWGIASAKDKTTMFQALQKQGLDATSALLSAPTQAKAPAAAPLPLDKLGQVAKIMEDISKPPGLKADVEFLVGYGRTVNSDMKSATPK